MEKRTGGIYFMMKYIRIWYRMTVNSFAIVLINRFGAIIFLFGKIIRFAFFFMFLLFLTQKTKTIAGYDLYQTAFFFLTFNLIDTTTQLLFREVYRFRPLIVSGRFDQVLIKPMNPLFRILAGGADLIDLFMLPPLILATIYVGSHIANINLGGIILYFVLLINSFFIALAFHILVAAMAVLTTEIDHTIMIYRDLTQMARVPLDVYAFPVRTILTFIIPVGIIMAFPVKAFLGLLSWQFIFYAFAFGIVAIFFSLQIWYYALTKYSSASS